MMDQAQKLLRDKKQILMYHFALHVFDVHL